MKIGINLHERLLLIIHQSSGSTKFLVLILGFFMSFPINSFSKNFYFSSSTGNDSYTATQAQNPATPWKTIDKLNSSMSLINPGDSVLFKRGDEFTGQITLTRSGTSSARLVFSAYGTGDIPVIKGTLPITGWKRYSGNIWVADCPKLGSTVTNFFINGKSQQIGRYPNADAPNKGYLNIDSHVGSTSLTSSSLSSTPNWTGGEAVVRSARWVLDRLPIQSLQGGNLVFSKPTTYEIKNNFGFFIQNHLNTLDQQGEWFFEPTNKKMFLYAYEDPNIFETVASAVSSVFSATNQRYFSIENIEFQGSINTTLKIIDSEYITISNIAVIESGADAVTFVNCNDISFTMSSIFNTNNNALGFHTCENVSVNNNAIHRTGTRSGMGLSSTGQYTGMTMIGDNNSCEANIIDSVGFNGIHFEGSSLVIRNNYIDHYCITLDDGAGLYTYGREKIINFDRRLENNIIRNGIGAGEGTDDLIYLPADGIYMDDRTANVTIINNTVTNTNNGILIHNSNHIYIIGNTVYNNRNTQLFFSHDNIVPDFPITNCTVNNNIFFARTESQMAAIFRTIDHGISNFGLFDNNYYCRPVADNATILVDFEGNQGKIYSLMNLAMWQSTFNYDLNSKKSPFSIPAFITLDLLSTNKVTNSNFDNDLTGWDFWSNYDNGNAKWDNSGDLDGGCLKLSFTSPSGKPDGVLSAVCKFGEVQAGENYVLRFSMIGSSPDQMVAIKMSKVGIPYNELTSGQFISFDFGEKEFELLFKPDTSETDARLDFVIRDDDGPIWIDNVTLYKAKIQRTNIDDFVLFVYNKENTNSTINLNKNYFDLSGNKYSGSITLLPYTSSVLMVDPHPLPPPTIPLNVSSAIENATPSIIEMTYNLSLANVVPAASAFSVHVNSAARSVSSVSISGSKVLLTLSSPVTFGNTVTVAYTKPSTNPLQTSAGGQAASLTSQTVTNRVAAPPVVVSPPVVVTSPPVIPNTAPVVVVSYLPTTNSGFLGVMNASDSYDKEKDNLTFTWEAPGNVPVSSTSGSIMQYLAPVVSTNQTLNFTVTVSDGKTSQSKTVPVQILPYHPELNKAEVVSVEASNFNSPNLPDNILDGNKGTMWSASGTDQWLILEIKTPFKIQHVKLAFQPGQKRESYFDIYGSNDKEKWELILSDSKSCAFSGDLQVFDFPVSKIERGFKFIKLAGLGNSADTWNYISEFNIFGYEHKKTSDYEDQIVKIYPNPARELVNVLIDEPTFFPDFIKILSLTGNIIYDNIVDPGVRQFQIPTDFNEGIYVLQMGTGEITMFTQKLIVIK